MNDLTYYVSKHKLFDKEDCPSIIEYLEKFSTWRPHEWYSQVEGNKTSLNDFVVTDNTKLAQQFQPGIQRALGEYADKKMGKYGQYFFNSFVRFNKYNVGEGIEEHVDHIHAIFKERPSGIPVISVVGCLNDDYEGGQFHLCGEPLDIGAGELILFPSVFLYPHYVTPVTAGCRYSWVSWAC